MSTPAPVGKSVLLVLAGPAGVGKSTLSERLVSEVPGFERVVTATTRPPRPNEREGRDYFFLTEPDFDRKLAAGEFLEWARVHEKYRYGTLKSAVLDRLPQAHLVMNIDVQGVRNLRAAAENLPMLRDRLVTVFVAPDSFDVLRQRLQGRGPVSMEELERRLRSAEAEMRERGSYDYVIHSATKEDDFRALLKIWETARSRLR
ncbi:MAG TPA: guanylate kinase [Opitutaceae bacterium]|nr:guanylate kinase [Opitutaceae bacterium]